MNRTFGVPKGRHEIARGVRPWNLEFLVKSPVRAAQSKSKKRVMTPAGEPPADPYEPQLYPRITPTLARIMRGFLSRSATDFGDCPELCRCCSREFMHNPGWATMTGNGER